ncbi:MAG: hypothetical protein ABSG18_16445 [Steroidobacteraceae bacterium]|jgi:hypothetical protein
MLRLLLIFALVGLALASLAGCTDHARVYPLDEATVRMGTPTFEFVKQGLGHGLVTITMPDGEVLRGEYQITENAAVGVGLAGAHMATAVGLGSGRLVVVNAVGDRGTISSCEGTADLGGHGSGTCHDSRGRDLEGGA